MKKFLLSFSLCIYLVIGYQIHLTVGHRTKKNEKEELHMHSLREEDLEKMIGTFDYLNSFEGDII